MGKIASTNGRIACVIPSDILSVIRDRKENLSITESRYGALIFEWWYRQGCPAVTPADAALLQLAKHKVAEGPSAKYPKR